MAPLAKQQGHRQQRQHAIKNIRHKEALRDSSTRIMLSHKLTVRNSFLYFSVLVLLLVLIETDHCQGYVTKEDETFLQNPFYATQSQIEDLFARFEKAYPERARVETIGRSLDGRNLIVLHIGRNVRRPRNLLSPLTKYVGNMHGDETIGRQLLIYLAQYLLYNYETSLEVGQLVNTTEIYLMPTMNPDGFARSQEGSCESLPNYVGRTNAAGIDLNRDFPDRLDSQQVTQLRSQQRQPETAALVEWILSRPFVLSANFHGGAVVASYPYDNSILHNECCSESLTPDDLVFKHLAHTYASNHPLMRNGHNCNDTFPGGITNGANWYELNGGMQDFNYAFSNCFELTLELSCCKYPPVSQLPHEWATNKRALLEYLKLAHIGVKGLVKDANGYPINDATIIVSGLEDKPMKTTKRGEYWRLLTPGLYNIQALAFGYQTSPAQQVHVTNQGDEAQRLDFILSPLEIGYDGAFRRLKTVRAEDAHTSSTSTVPTTASALWGGAKNNATQSQRNPVPPPAFMTVGSGSRPGSGTGFDDFLTPTNFVHHNYEEMKAYLREITVKYPSLTRLYTIGRSVQGRELWVMEIFGGGPLGQHKAGVPEFKYVANMHGNEVVGKELLLLLTKYLCEHYSYDGSNTEAIHKRIQIMLNTTRLHFLYSMNPDGYEISVEGDRNSAKGRSNAHQIDLNRNFPDQYGTDNYNRHTEPEVAAVMNWTLSIPFVLSANLHGGSLVANYPFDDNADDFHNLMARMRFSGGGGPKRDKNPTDDDELFQHLAHVYASAHPSMHNGSPCPQYKNELFPGGITNGAQWYSVTGGMQDWNYIRAGVLELTIELGCDKFPMAVELPQYWRDNREALLQFIEQTHYGVYGFVRSSIGNPVSGAGITLNNTKHSTFSGISGDYWKLALPGRHNLTIMADGFTPQRVEIEIPLAEPRSIRYDISLMRDDPQHWASANDYRVIVNVVKTHYRNNSELRREMAEFEVKDGQIAAFGYAESEFGFNYNNVKMTSDIGEPEENRFKILIVSSLFDTVSPLGREITLNLIRHLIEGFHISEPPVVELLKGSVLHFVPITENYNEIFQMYMDNPSVCDPVIGNELADKILLSKSDKKRDLFLQFLESERFDLMMTFTTGTSELSYPKGDSRLETFAREINNVEFGFAPLQCPLTSARSLQHDATERLTNLFYKMYGIPLFSIGLDCCRMPEQNEIAMIWRKNLPRLKNFLALARTGVTGIVQNGNGEALRHAYIRILDDEIGMTANIHNVSLNAARFQLMLPPNEHYTLEISASGFESRRLTVTTEQLKLNDLGIIKLNPYSLVTGRSEIHPLGSGDVIQLSSLTAGVAGGTTSISGFVLDTSNSPIRAAKVYVAEATSTIRQRPAAADSKPPLHRNFTDSLGAFSISDVPMGSTVTLKVDAPRHLSTTLVVPVGTTGAPVRGIIFHLTYDEHVFGMPRLLFIILASLLSIIAMVVCITCAQFVLQRMRRGDKRYYSFSLLPQQQQRKPDVNDLFADDDDDEAGETELFRSPIKKSVIRQPYYDEDDVDIANGGRHDNIDEFDENDDDDDDDDEEDDVFRADTQAEKIVMLDRRGMY